MCFHLGLTCLAHAVKCLFYYYKLLWVRVRWAAQTGVVSGLRSLLLLVSESRETSRVSKQSLQRLWIWACREPQHCEKLQISSVTRKILLKYQDYLSSHLTDAVRCIG